MVATQDDDLRKLLNRVPGVPTIYFNKVTLVLESPSETSLKFSNQVINVGRVIFRYT